MRAEKRLHLALHPREWLYIIPRLRPEHEVGVLVCICCTSPASSFLVPLWTFLTCTTLRLLVTRQTAGLHAVGLGHRFIGSDRVKPFLVWRCSLAWHHFPSQHGKQGQVKCQENENTSTEEGRRIEFSVYADQLPDPDNSGYRAFLAAFLALVRTPARMKPYGVTSRRAIETRNVLDEEAMPICVY